MFFKYCLVIILCLKTIHGSPVSPLSLEDLTAQHTEEVIRQTKSADMRRYFNESVDPCEDFYEYSCGNYYKYNPTNKTTSTLERLQKALYDKIKRMLEVDEPTDTDIDKKIKNYYRSCLSAPAMVSDYKVKLRDLVKEFGDMPVLEGDDWQEGDFDWKKIVPQIIHKTGLKILFEIGIATDFHNNSIIRATFAAPALALHRTFYVEEAISGEREERQTKIADNLHTFMGVEMKLASETAKEIIDFETILAHGTHDFRLDVDFDEIYTVEPIEEVQEKYLTTWDTKQLVTDTIGFTPDVLIVENEYLSYAMGVLENVNQKALANYIFYNYLDKYFFDLKKNSTEFEEFCIEDTKEMFYENLVNSIYRKYFTEQTKEGVLFMWQELKAAFEKVLLSPHLEWMQEDTRRYAVEKLKATKLEILSYEEDNISQKFSEVSINDHDYVHNIYAVLTVLGDRIRAKFNEPPQQEILKTYSPFNSIIENTVKVPIDVLQPYYAFSSSYPYAYNFGTLGFFIGHELVHGFDDGGRKFDALGNARDWWDEESAREFRDHTKCFVDQYKQYSFGGHPLPELLNQGENIADNGGVRLAYDAYLSWYEKTHGSDESTLSSESFPGLNYTNKQLFFLSYAQVWCAATHPDYKAAKAASDIHVPENFRAIGPLANFEEFAKVFNCPKGSVMNPIKKCEIY